MNTQVEDNLSIADFAEKPITLRELELMIKLIPTWKNNNRQTSKEFLRKKIHLESGVLCSLNIQQSSKGWRVSQITIKCFNEVLFIASVAITDKWPLITYRKKEKIYKSSETLIKEFSEILNGGTLSLNIHVPSDHKSLEEFKRLNE